MATYPYQDPLAQRKRTVTPPPPPDARPLTVTPGAQSDQRDATYDDATQQWTPALPAPPAASTQPAGSAPMWGMGHPAAAPVPSSGLNSVGQALAKLKSSPPQPLPTPNVEDDINPSVAMQQPVQPRLADFSPPPGMKLSQTASDLAKLRETRNAPLNAPVTTDEYGLPQVGAAKPITRKHEILQGLLQGALAGGAAAGLKGAIGGAATGGIAGAVNPSLIAALERHQEEGRIQGDIDTDFANTSKQAQIGDIQAQTTQRNQQPVIEQYRINEQNRREADLEAGRNARSQASITAANQRARMRADRELARTQSTESRPQYHTLDNGDLLEVRPDPNGGPPITRTIASGSKGSQKVAKAKALWDTAGKLYDDSTNGYEALISKAETLRDQADKLGKDATGEVDYKAQLDNATQIKVLQKQADRAEKDADDLKKKVQTMQSQGDDANAEGQAQMAPKAGKSGTAKTFNLKLWKTDHPDATPEQVAAKRKQYSAFQIIE